MAFVFKSAVAMMVASEPGCTRQVVYDEEGQVWAMLHSGSRNVGNQAASHHDKVAQEKGFADPGGLNHMRIDSREGQAYLQVESGAACRSNPTTADLRPQLLIVSPMTAIREAS